MSVGVTEACVDKLRVLFARGRPATAEKQENDEEKERSREACVAKAETDVS